MDAEHNMIDRDDRTRNWATPRGKVSRWLGCCLAVPLSILVLAGFLWWYESVPDRKVEKMLADDGPGVGATRGEVEAWLDRRSIRHSRVKSLEDSDGYPAGQPPSRFGDLVPDVQDEYVLGKIHASDLQNSAG